MWQAISQQLSDTLMFDFQIVEKQKIHGGDISECYMISDNTQRYFIKLNRVECLHNFEAEAENIALLRQTSSVFVPELVMLGKTKEHAFLVLNYLPTKPLDDAANSYKFGQQLAKLHNWGEQKEYGLDIDNYLGEMLQPNKWEKKWSHFFAEQRIGWQLQLMREKGIELVDITEFTQVIRELLNGHQPKPSLLHGDLWHGNTAISAFGPLCFDPACYWGDRECDLALTELFGGFQAEFYQGYESISPLSYSYPQRKTIYNLYHILNHYNHFGGHYLDQAQKMIDEVMSY
ncbi:Fructosamine-3-kinase [Vibrio xiamenensis]|uniref:Fructosamine-3-kinase n=1 Tax=Vibrio xiamenensis TaxID=861298 RepID=A0A1G7YAV6_9VIBR|nr:fructosamine kinase family protein [Vibrio xiamenensis]SDG93622.1 Fructosamine-3-kinase [Vibrio xiamenensis]